MMMMMMMITVIIQSQVSSWSLLSQQFSSLKFPCDDNYYNYYSVSPSPFSPDWCLAPIPASILLLRPTLQSSVQYSSHLILNLRNPRRSSPPNKCRHATQTSNAMRSHKRHLAVGQWRWWRWREGTEERIRGWRRMDEQEELSGWAVVPRLKTSGWGGEAMNQEERRSFKSWSQILRGSADNITIVMREQQLSRL